MDKSTARTIQVELPLPPRQLHPNARPHWAARARHTAASRNTAACLAVNHRPGAPFTHAEITAHFVFRTAARHDPDNLVAWLKAAIDGLVDAKILADDSHVTHRPPIQRKAKAGERIGVTLEISQEGEANAK